MKSFSLFTLLVVGLFSFSGHAAAFSGTGTGVNGDPYLVTSCAQLLEVDSSLDAEYLVTTDLDCTANGNDAVVSGDFTGVFNGGGHTITLVVDSTENNIGLFAVLNGATISDVLVAGSITSTGNTVGGIAGAASGSSTITRVANTATIRGVSYSGGILGNASGITLSDSYNTGDVSNSSSQTVGGIVGFISGTSTVTKTYNRGIIGKADESRYHLGGIMGQRASTSTLVSNNFNVGQILTAQSTFFFGGIWGNDIPSNTSTLSTGFTNNFFDATRSTRTMCGYGNSGSNLETVSGQCESINTGADTYDYFKNNSTNAPLDTWDFENVWETNVDGYPSLRSIVGDGGAVNDNPEEADVTAPIVETLSPADGTDSVAADTNIVLTFDEPVVKGSGLITLASGENNIVIENINVTSGQVTDEGTTTITIDPSFEILPGTEVFVNIPNTAFKDASDNYFAGFTGGLGNVPTFTIAYAPYVLTEIKPIPAKVRGNTATYTFSVSGEGEAQYIAEMCGGNSDGFFTSMSDDPEHQSVTLTGLEPGITYECQFAVQSLSGYSNFLTMGPFVVTNPSSVGGYASPTTLAKAGVTLAPTSNNKNVCPADQILTFPVDIKKLQAHLVRLGFNPGPIDGISGPMTKNAIKQAQVKLGTLADGLVGPLTRNLINNSCTK